MGAPKELTPEQQIAALQKQLTDQARAHDDELRAVKGESEAKDAILEAQSKQLAAAKAQGAGQLSVVTHEDQNYQVLAGRFSVDGKVYSHEDLQTNPELVKRLVDEGSGLLHLIEEASTEAEA